MQHIVKVVFTTLLLICSTLAYAQRLTVPAYMEDAVSCTTQPISQSLIQSVQAECIQKGKSRELSDSRTTGFKALVSKRGKVMFAARFSCGGVTYIAVWVIIRHLPSRRRGQQHKN